LRYVSPPFLFVFILYRIVERLSRCFFDVTRKRSDIVEEGLAPPALKRVNRPFGCRRGGGLTKPSSGRKGDHEVVEGACDNSDLAMLNFFITHSPSVASRQRLAAARSRSGSNTPPACNSLPSRRFATSRREPLSPFPIIRRKTKKTDAVKMRRSFLFIRGHSPSGFSAVTVTFLLPFLVLRAFIT